MDKQILDEYIQAIKSQYNQNYTGYSMHPEEGRDNKINSELLKINNDLSQIDNAIMSIGQQVYDLMTNTILRLNNIHANIMIEKERYQDMQMLCNKYNDYDHVKLLDNNDFRGEFYYENNLYSPERVKTKDVGLQVIDVSGNGYEGNKYVYKDFKYTNSVLDTSLRKNIVDKKITTYYEYSRITMNNTEDVSLFDFNKDNKDAVCTITLMAEDPINEIEIKSDETNVVITEIAYSEDGITYEQLDIPYVSINNKLDSYENKGYVYGSGKICFPKQIRLFKLTFESNGYTNDVLAYEKALYSYENEEEESDYIYNSNEIDSSITPDIDYVTMIVKSAKRHVIKINEITAGSYQYKTKSRMQSVELLDQDVYAISVFANVYIPEGLSDSAVEFILTINGRDYDVVPINSHLNGVKIIRFSTGTASSAYTRRIGEKIKSAYLTIVFTNESRIAPYINNIKVLLGGEL